MRRIAIRGMAWLAAAVCMSMLFSGTMKTMTTAKVQTVVAKKGRLEERVRLAGRLVFPDTVELTVPSMDEEAVLNVRTVEVSAGRWVEAGEPLFSADVSGYEKQYAAYQAEFDAAQSELLEIDRKMGTLRLTRMEEMWLEAYDALAAAERAVLSAQTELVVHDNLHGGQGEARQGLEEALAHAQARREEAQEAYERVNRLGVNQDLMRLVLDSRGAQERMQEASGKITALRTLKERAACVRAPHTGYVASVSVRAGETYNGRGPAVVMSADSPDGAGGVLRADLSGTDKRIEPGMKVVLSGGGREVAAEVTARGMDAGGGWYADAAVTRAQIEELGGAARLMREDAEMTCTYRAQESTTLLPVSAVRGSGEHRYVYILSEKHGGLGEPVMTAVRQEVHVLAESEDTVSIEEELGRQRIAYMEDRPIDDGTEVMIYAQ